MLSGDDEFHILTKGFEDEELPTSHSVLYPRRTHEWIAELMDPSRKPPWRKTMNLESKEQDISPLNRKSNLLIDGHNQSNGNGAGL